MQENRPSLTARRVAMSRAAHQLFDHPTVLTDPVALAILGPGGEQEVRSRRGRFLTALSRHLRAFLVARSRVAEDALAEAVTRDVRQYVILGAGFDTFAYRNPYPATRLRVFEVDHPATQAWKRELITAAGIALPAALTFVPVDFERQSLPEALRAAGFQPGERTFFSWLGVTMYLTREVVLGTLRYVAHSLPYGSGVVFDYAAPPPRVSLTRRLLYRYLIRRVARAGEPFKSFFVPAALAQEMRTFGYSHLEDLGAADLNARYFRNRADRLRVSGPAHVMSARL
jgi:methyltransferase (TIGR00027 family)